MIVRPGLTRRHSLLLISPRGARILASIHAEHPATYVERSRQARTYHWRAPHDLGANDLFVWLALESRDPPDSGLLYWIGEETMRAHYRQIATGRRDGMMYPRTTQVVMPPLPGGLRSMDDPCDGVPENAFCDNQHSRSGGRG